MLDNAIWHRQHGGDPRQGPRRAQHSHYIRIRVDDMVFQDLAGLAGYLGEPKRLYPSQQAVWLACPNSPVTSSSQSNGANSLLYFPPTPSYQTGAQPPGGPLNNFQLFEDSYTNAKRCGYYIARIQRGGIDMAYCIESCYPEGIKSPMPDLHNLADRIS